MEQTRDTGKSDQETSVFKDVWTESFVENPGLEVSEDVLNQWVRTGR